MTVPDGPPPLPKADVLISDLTPVKSTVGWGERARVDKSIEDNPLRISGVTFEKGMGIHAVSELVYDLRPEYERFVARVRSSRALVGGMLMDQSVIAGVGNIYRAEVLFRHRISPYAEGRQVSVAKLRAVWEDLVVLMHDGVRRGRIVTVDPADVETLMDRAAYVALTGNPEGGIAIYGLLFYCAPFLAP